MKKLMIFVGLLLLTSCGLITSYAELEYPCRQCMTIYDPMIHPPETFSVCNEKDYNYWNGRESTMTDELGNTFQLITTCE